MNITQMQLFLTCSALMNFQKAAQIHYMSVSTVSRHIRSLEEEMGTKLFVGEGRKVSLTIEGMWTFDYVIEVLQRTRKLYQQIHPEKKQDVPFRISSYAFDGTFRHISNIFSWYPSEVVKRPLRFDFVPAGEMIRTVMNGDAELGIETKAQLQPLGDRVVKKPLFRSDFKLLVSPGHRLAKLESIDISDLLTDYGYYGNFAFDAQQHLELEKVPIRDAQTLALIGENTIRHMPEIFQKYSNRGTITQVDRIMMIVPETLNDPHFRELVPVKLTGGELTTSFTLFWKNDSDQADIKAFIDLLSHAGTV